MTKGRQLELLSTRMKLFFAASILFRIHSVAAFSPKSNIFGSFRLYSGLDVSLSSRRSRFTLSFREEDVLDVNNVDGANGMKGRNGKHDGFGFKYQSRSSPFPSTARVSLVGAGPGDPELLTLKAARILEDPNALIVSDRLVSKEILNMVKGELRIARKQPGCAEKAQEQIYDWALEGLQEGRHVVRLKIGDPFVFGRGGEEVLKFREFGVEPLVVPGVSAAFSAPLLGGIPVTHRGVSNQVVMCTGYGRDGTSPDLIQYHEEQTVVFLMAVGRLHELCAKLIELAGYPNDTPVGIIERAGCPDQRTLVGDLTTIAALADKYSIKAPSTIVVGKVVNVLLEDATPGEKELAGVITQAITVTSENKAVTSKSAKLDCVLFA
mmetsp:Transcript_23855/g.47431  ORF Transcript_23855/g.47431 Transcript_23855/m.47431 type:complete len:380 (+) Transcript_23855:191-1330(+)|eukprot:CAMPEP_0194307570 /NCGR_PEP_ID=MMETSP0171-20130528/4461_1 /TAXON_ID=218684 /ORGANISM="Corethron pennatum, Strain L29A3" /LENGTH=379 /DNA_ID=CAMNT_0039059705 /DNA_START=136 /DNA_END=1275 /DNA_ORIENTATION=-